MRLRDGQHRQDRSSSFSISIPSGAIKRGLISPNHPNPELISIPSGAIKSVGTERIHLHGIIISIPSGAIKRGISATITIVDELFQFLLVRLRGL